MSVIKVQLEEKTLKIEQVRDRQTLADTATINIDQLIYNKGYSSEIHVASKKNMNKILFIKPYQALRIYDQGENGEENDSDGEEGNREIDLIAVWTTDRKVYYGYINERTLYQKFFKFTYRVLHIGLNRRGLSLWILGYFHKKNPDLKIEQVRFSVDENNWRQSKMNIVDKPLPFLKKLSLKNIHHYKIPMDDLQNSEVQINNTLNMIVKVDGHDIEFRIGKKNRFFDSTRMYYAPYKGCYTRGYAFHLRRTDRGNFAIVKRTMEEVEHKPMFRFMESKPVSFVLYHLGRMVSARAKKNVNLFYEKFAGKAEEGTFELFQMSLQRGNSNCYYIIDKDSSDYERIKDEKNVVKKYSLKYYWLIYRVNHYISTEAPAHLNILRSNNKYFRFSTCEHPFIFLQHGITYLKCQGPSSTFVAGKEGEPDYMIVGSKKERDVCVDMLKIPEERFLNTGLPIFSKVVYGHMTQESPDKAVIMLTWKTYEEHIQNFEESEYYQNVMEIYHILEKYMNKEDIYIVPHPKMAEHLSGTSMADAIWKEPISKVLEIAKLLVTDYSSACYNSFYQGGAVVFYQPDLEKYERESGMLIPEESEYIGARVYHPKELEQVIAKIIPDGKIILREGRTEEYERRYGTINEYSDGKNIERIFEQLQRLYIV